MAALQETPSANRIHIGFFRKAEQRKILSSQCFWQGRRYLLFLRKRGRPRIRSVNRWKFRVLAPVFWWIRPDLTTSAPLGSQRVEKTRQAAEKSGHCPAFVYAGRSGRRKSMVCLLEEHKVPVILTVSKARSGRGCGGGRRCVQRLFGEVGYGQCSGRE